MGGDISSSSAECGHPDADATIVPLRRRPVRPAQGKVVQAQRCSRGGAEHLMPEEGGGTFDAQGGGEHLMTDAVINEGIEEVTMSSAMERRQ